MWIHVPVMLLGLGAGEVGVFVGETSFQFTFHAIDSVLRFNPERRSMQFHAMDSELVFNPCRHTFQFLADSTLVEFEGDQ